MNPKYKFILSINMAMTLDGKVERPDGKWYGLSSREDKRRMDRYRSESEVLILGKNSILNDNPIIHLRYETGNEPQPVILVRNGNIPDDRHVFRHSKVKPILLTTKKNVTNLSPSLESLSKIVVLGESDFSAGDVVHYLCESNYSSGLLEGGPTLNAAFFREDLVSVIYITVTPFLIGKSSLLSICNNPVELDNFENKKWILEKVEQIQNEIFLKYKKEINTQGSILNYNLYQFFVCIPDEPAKPAASSILVLNISNFFY